MPDHYNLQKYKEELKRHDWLHPFSDDPKVFRRGSVESQRLLQIAFSNSDAHKAAYNAAHRRAWDIRPFNQRPNYQYKEPFPIKTLSNQ